MIEISLPAVATLTTQITPTSSLQWSGGQPAALNAASRGVATLSIQVGGGLNVPSSGIDPAAFASALAFSAAHG